MENFMKKVTNKLQSMENKLSKYGTLYLKKMSNDCGSCGVAIVDSVSGNSQEKDLHNLKASFSNLKKLVENMQKQLEEVEKKNDDLEQYSRSNCFIVHKCKDVPKKGKYLECENYICDKLNDSLPLNSKLISWVVADPMTVF